MTDTFSKIATIDVPSGGATSIDFTNIPSIYNDLCIISSIRANADNTNVFINFNNDTGSNYYITVLYDSNGTIGSTASSAQTKIANGSGANAGVSYTANVYSNNIYYIPNYLSSFQKTIHTNGVTENNGSGIDLSLISGRWSGTAAISRIALTPPSSYFMQYSTATLYGIKTS